MTSTVFLHVEDALPDLARRPFPVIEEGSAILVAGTVLDIPRREVLPIVRLTEDGTTFSLTEGERGHRVFSGYSLIRRILHTDPEEWYRLLFEPCENASMTMRSIPGEALILTNVLETFSREKFGWALIDREGALPAVMGLADLIPLYRTGVLQTELTLREIATPEIFSLPGATTIEAALREMMKRRVRRVRLSKSGDFVSDREILVHIFSPDVLNAVRAAPHKLLDSTLEEVEPRTPLQVDPATTVEELAGQFPPESGAWSALCGEGLATPWDLIMKPWDLGQLRVGGVLRVPPG
jgi:CBS domain-containing protein